MSETISRDDWLKALADVATVPDDDPSALTAMEFAALFQIGPTTARSRLKELAARQRVVPTTKIIQSSDGRRLRVNAYRLVDAPPAA